MDDARIVQLYFDRDQQAIAATAEKYGSYCASIAGNILDRREDAEECVNDTYLNTWNAIPPHRPRMLSTFLGKIVRNLAFNKYKHNAAEKRGSGEITLVLDELAGCVSGKDDLEQIYEYRELVAAINGFLGRLPPEKRNIFVCRYWYADSVAQIAARYQMTAAGVSMTLSRMRDKLRGELIEWGYEP